VTTGCGTSGVGCGISGGVEFGLKTGGSGITGGRGVSGGGVCRGPGTNVGATITEPDEYSVGSPCGGGGGAGLEPPGGLGEGKIRSDAVGSGPMEDASGGDGVTGDGWMVNEGIRADCVSGIGGGATLVPPDC
jgi:hypothetical protein